MLLPLYELKCHCWHHCRDPKTHAGPTPKYDWNTLIWCHFKMNFKAWKEVGKISPRTPEKALKNPQPWSNYISAVLVVFVWISVFLSPESWMFLRENAVVLNGYKYRKYWKISNYNNKSVPLINRLLLCDFLPLKSRISRGDTLFVDLYLLLKWNRWLLKARLKRIRWTDSY